jgi:hypothetical protein
MMTSSPPIKRQAQLNPRFPDGNFADPAANHFRDRRSNSSSFTQAL